jgi:hypothetical protein
MSLWEKDTDQERLIYERMDHFLNKNNNLLIIGEDIGKWTLYGSRKANQVFTFNVRDTFKDSLYKNVKYNCDNVCLLENVNIDYNLVDKIVNDTVADKIINVPFSNIDSSDKSDNILDSISLNHLGMIIINICGEEQDIVDYYTNTRNSFVQDYSNPLLKIGCYVMFDYSEMEK